MHEEPTVTWKLWRPAGHHFLGPMVESVIAVQRLAGGLAGWSAFLDLRIDDEGHVVVHEVALRPDEWAEWSAPPTQRALRELHQRHVLDHVRRHFTEMTAEHRRRAPTDPFDPSRWTEAFNKGRRPGRSRVDIGWYAEMAARRVRAHDVAPDRPIKWMAEEYKQTEASINALLHKARRAKLLEGSRPPQLTRKAKLLLGQEED